MPAVFSGSYEAGTIVAAHGNRCLRGKPWAVPAVLPPSDPETDDLVIGLICRERYKRKGWWSLDGTPGSRRVSESSGTTD